MSLLPLQLFKNLADETRRSCLSLSLNPILLADKAVFIAMIFAAQRLNPSPTS
ncbi:Uncharacterised protein [Klebsiella pneumoniae]|nr:Uncharacterised protein [Klebsiella pneumoniae]